VTEVDMKGLDCLSLKMHTLRWVQLRELDGVQDLLLQRSTSIWASDTNRMNIASIVVHYY